MSATTRDTPFHENNTDSLAKSCLEWTPGSRLRRFRRFVADAQSTIFIFTVVIHSVYFSKIFIIFSHVFFEGKFVDIGAEFNEP